MSALILARSGLKEEPFRNTKGRMKRDDANATVFGAVGNIFQIRQVTGSRASPRDVTTLEPLARVVPREADE